MDLNFRYNEDFNRLSTDLDNGLNKIATLEYEKIPGLLDKLQDLRDTAEKISQKANALYDQMTKDNCLANGYDDFMDRVSVVLSATDPESLPLRSIHDSLSAKLIHGAELSTESVFNIMSDAVVPRRMLFGYGIM